MRKSVYGLLIRAGAGAVLAMQSSAVHGWHWFVYSPQPRGMLRWAGSPGTSPAARPETH